MSFAITTLKWNLWPPLIQLSYCTKFFVCFRFVYQQGPYVHYLYLFNLWKALPITHIHHSALTWDVFDMESFEKLAGNFNSGLDETSSSDDLMCFEIATANGRYLLAIRPQKSMWRCHIKDAMRARLGQSRCNEGNCARRAIIGHKRHLDRWPLLSDIVQNIFFTDALKQTSAHKENSFHVVDDQSLVMIVSGRLFSALLTWASGRAIDT